MGSIEEREAQTVDIWRGRAQRGIRAQGVPVEFGDVATSCP